MTEPEDRRDWQVDVFREVSGAGAAEATPDRAARAHGEEEILGHAGHTEPAAGQDTSDARHVHPATRPEPWSAPPPEWPPPTTLPRPGAAPAPYRTRPSTPVNSPPQAPEPDRALGRVRHGYPFTRRAVRATRRLLTSSSGGEAETLAHAARLIQQPITTGRQIAVTSIRGGAGKSTVTALLALTFAHFRPDPVLAVEADAVLGTLPGRLGTPEPRWTCGDLAGILDPSMRITDVTGYLLPFTGGWLLPGGRGRADGPVEPLSLQAYWTATTSLRRFFGTTVVDCPTLPAEVARLALATTQARVLVAPATAEGVATARWVLDWAGSLDAGMLATTVVALAHTSPDMALDQRWAAGRLEVGGASMVSVPYDRSLAPGGAIRTALLSQGVREAATRLAGLAMDRAAARHHPSQPGRNGEAGGGPR